MSNTTAMSAKERIEAFVDPNSFVEIGALVTKRNTDFNMQEKTVPADGVITGYGVVDSNLVYVYSQDVTAMKGSIGEMHARKIARLYEMAMKVGAPVVGLIDCAGIRVQEATDALAGFGDIYFSQVKASGVIPQISAIFGSCGGGVAISSVLSDFTFIEKNNGKIFVNSPNAIAGNSVETCDTSAADYQGKAGVVDVVCEGEEAMLQSVRSLISLLPANNENDAFKECEDDMNRLVPGFGNDVSDPVAYLSQLADDNFFFETKKDFGAEMVTGLFTLNGVTVGAVANKEESLSTDGCRKAESLVKFCDAFGIPVISFTNVNGYAASKEEEATIAVAVAKMTYAFASANVPKINVIVGKAFGSSYVSMNSKHIGADLVFALDQAKVGVMDAKAACQVMYEDEIAKAKDSKAALEDKVKEYDATQNDVSAAAKRGYIDNVVEGDSMRKHLIYAVEMLYSKKESMPNKKHGTV